MVIMVMLIRLKTTTIVDVRIVIFVALNQSVLRFSQTLRIVDNTLESTSVSTTMVLVINNLAAAL